MAYHAFMSVLILLPTIPFEVFFSCRGDDVRSSFTDHLYVAFVQAGIRTFRDDDGIPAGENIKLAIKRAIYESKVSIVVLSKDYATSVNCLDELVMIMERRTIDGYIVVPIFYHVDPSDVGQQTGSYGEAFAGHDKQFKDRIDRVEKWRKALKQVAELQGLILDHQHESQFIQHIVQEVENKLTRQEPKAAFYFSWNNVMFIKLMFSVLLIIPLFFLPDIKKAIYASGILIILMVMRLCFFNMALPQT